MLRVRFPTDAGAGRLHTNAVRQDFWNGSPEAPGESRAFPRVGGRFRWTAGIRGVRENVRGIVHKKINTSYVIFLAATAALGGLLFGFDIAIITGAGPFITEYFKLTDLSLGWAFSSLLFGCVIGSVFAGRITNSYGRRKVLLWVSLLFMVTSVATGEASNFTFFVAARFMGGSPSAAPPSFLPCMSRKCPHPRMRGRMGTLYQLSIVTGVLISYCINYLLRNAGASNWRWMFITGVIPSALFFVLLLRAPETPRYLFMAGRPQEAFAILERISGRETAEFEIAEMRASTAENNPPWRALWQPGIRRAVVVGFLPGHPDARVRHQYDHRLRSGHLQIGGLED